MLKTCETLWLQIFSSPFFFAGIFYLSPAWHPSVPSLFQFVNSFICSFFSIPTFSRKGKSKGFYSTVRKIAVPLPRFQTQSLVMGRNREREIERERKRERPRHSGVQAPCWAEAILPYTILSLQTHRWGRREQKAAQSQLSPLLNGFLLRAAYIYSDIRERKKKSAFCYCN